MGADAIALFRAACHRRVLGVLRVWCGVPLPFLLLGGLEARASDGAEPRVRIVRDKAQPHRVLARSIDHQIHGAEMRLGGEECDQVLLGISGDAGDALHALARCRGENGDHARIRDQDVAHFIDRPADVFLRVEVYLEQARVGEAPFLHCLLAATVDRAGNRNGGQLLFQFVGLFLFPVSDQRADLCDRCGIFVAADGIDQIAQRGFAAGLPGFGLGVVIDRGVVFGGVM